MSNLYVALVITFLAGMTTAIGSAIAFFTQRTNYRFLSVATGFSAGAMLYVSFSELLPRSAMYFSLYYGEPFSRWLHLSAFFGGIVLIGIIDMLVPSEENPHEFQSGVSFEKPEMSCGVTVANRGKILSRAGIFTTLAIGIHNVPEGLTTFFSTLENYQIGITIAVAIALHNIPEGITVSVPIFYATGSRFKAFIYSALTGLAEPLGALISYSIITYIFGDIGISRILGFIMGAIGGIMVYVSIDELLPVSRAYGKGHDSIIGFLLGMGFTAVGLTLF